MSHRKHGLPAFNVQLLQYIVVSFITYQPPEHVRIEMWNGITAIIYFIFLLGVSLGKKNRVSNKKNYPLHTFDELCGTTAAKPKTVRKKSV